MVFIRIGVVFVLMTFSCFVGIAISIANEAWDELIGPGIASPS